MPFTLIDTFRVPVLVWGARRKAALREETVSRQPGPLIVV